jgi:hypothetical protein
VKADPYIHGSLWRLRLYMVAKHRVIDGESSWRCPNHSQNLLRQLAHSLQLRECKQGLWKALSVFVWVI